jgi:surfactin synthase thioesterase subunit
MGLGGMKYAWQRQTRDFGHTKGDQYSSLVTDNRGIGDSDKPTSRYSTSAMAQDIVEVLDHIGWTGKRELHVIGISMGGMIAQEIVSSFISALSLVQNIRALTFGPDAILSVHEHKCRRQKLQTSLIPSIIL